MRERANQMSLQLRERPGWGGRREGAGRKRAPAAGTPHRSRPGFSSLPAHVTFKVRSGIPSLRTGRMVREIERSFAEGCTRPGFRLVHYSLQRNHVHLMVEARNREALGRGMKAIGGRLAHAVNRVCARSGRVFVDRYHLHVLKTPREVRAALRYVLLNARKHAKQLGAVVRLDPASSCRWFDGWRREAMKTVVREKERPPGYVAVARARTWLLRVGWRRHGLLDPADVPG